MKGNNQAASYGFVCFCSFSYCRLEIQAQEKGDSITGKVHKNRRGCGNAKRPPQTK